MDPGRTVLAVSALMLGALAGAAEPPKAGGPAAGKFAPNPELKALPEQAVKVLVPGGGYKADANVLDYSGMVYDHHRHKILAFGGGHATARFPNSVHEFDPATLKWTALTEDVPPAAYTAENSVRTKDGQKLGGVKWAGKIWAGSRHTYDGLNLLPDADLMVSAQAQEFQSTACPAGYRENYQGGGGLWIFDPVKREWSVSEKDGLALSYCISEISPKAPDWIYMWSSDLGGNQAVNWKTGETKKVRDLPNKSMGYAGVTWCPETGTFWCFPAKKAWEYDPQADAWKTHPVKGEVPNTYDVNPVWDPVAGVFGLFSGGKFHYFSTAELTWHGLAAELDKDLDNGPMRHHHVYDPVDNVHLAVSGRWKTLAFKFMDKPGSLPGTTQPKN
jgi:hypothetical protein